MDKYSFLNAVHPEYLATLYDKYLKYPDSIEPSWRAFFQGFDFAIENGSLEGLGISQEIPEHITKEFKVVKLIDGYRTRGHLFTKTNPVRARRKYAPTLDIENFGLTPDDLPLKFKAGEILGIGEATLEEIITHLQRIYCDAIGIEYMYIRQPEIIEWIQNKLNINDNQPNFTAQQKKHILKKLTEAVAFENFLHTKYVGQKRFSLEGGESFIPALDALIESASKKGVKEFVMGMAHRGRLSTLTNIFGKSAKDIFSEFDGKDYAQDIFDGDVKYHLGWTANRTTDNGKNIRLNMAPNPSHLETVGAVVEGITRAKQDKDFVSNEKEALPIVVHGDAAIAGQGVVYEVVQMAQLEGYTTKGTVHIVINNQIGFTTNYLDARSSTYCTDVAKVTLSPVLHVNADDAEAVVHAMLFALDFRMEFGRDVFIDLLGYRKYGHNEGDEPRFTQPKLYPTGFNLKELDEIAKEVTQLPKDKKFLRKIVRLIEARNDMYFKDNALDWAMGETLAYATLLKEGYDVRMSGQDVERGTFSHRHAVIKVEDSEEEIVLLNSITEQKGKFNIYNSLLSEYGVVGFEYGYAMASPKTLTIWEAQFGDFSNGAQIMIDQYISAAEDKWKLQNGLVMFLPHGYEGQGAEHSSARIERYLQLCARDNMFVANCTTPANMFHILRRQMHVDYRKPLIIFTPKSLLRHPKAVSPREAFANGSFKTIIDDETVETNNVKTLVFVSGKFYYDLLEKREELNRNDVALVRLEQLFPLPKDQIHAILAKYSQADDIVWAQEEPRNMGAYSYLLLHLEEVKNFRVCSRNFYSAPASGSALRSQRRHQKVIESVFNPTQQNN